MKLINKKTGEINLGDLHLDDFNSLAELNAEWEDYEEPTDHWHITFEGVICDLNPKLLPEHSRNAKSIGNFFETKEEAVKAVEKLKAWKRLKDKGFRFIDHTDFDDGNITIWGKFNKELDEQDVDLLFGGEE